LEIAPQREEDVPAWDGGDRRDPGGEKVVYSMLALMFGALAAMPWLPPGKRYCRAMTRSRRFEERERV